MYKIIIPACILTILALACSQKLAPVNSVSEKAVEQKQPTADSVAKAEQPASTNPVEGVSKESLIASGEIVFTARCGRCHELKNPANYTSERWDAILKVMAPRAKLNPEEQYQVQAYVRAHAKQ